MTVRERELKIETLRQILRVMNSDQVNRDVDKLEVEILAEIEWLKGVVED